MNNVNILKTLVITFAGLLYGPAPMLDALRDLANNTDYPHLHLELFKGRECAEIKPQHVDQQFLEKMTKSDTLVIKLDRSVQIDVDLRLPENAILKVLDAAKDMPEFVRFEETDEMLNAEDVETSRLLTEWCNAHGVEVPQITNFKGTIQLGEFSLSMILVSPVSRLVLRRGKDKLDKLCVFNGLTSHTITYALDSLYQLSNMLRAQE